MQKKYKFIFFILSILLGSLIFASQALASQEDSICAVYFSGIGCPHCAKTDPVIFKNLLKEFPNLIIIEYEIYQQKENAPLLYKYNQQYQSELGVPLIIFGKNQFIIGDTPILKNIRKAIGTFKSNKCPLADGRSVDFRNLDLTSLPQFPKIWHQEKILIKKGTEGNNKTLKQLLFSDNPEDFLAKEQFEKAKPTKVALSGRSVNFDKAVKVNDWLFQWNEKTNIKIPSSISESKENTTTSKNLETKQNTAFKTKLTFPKIVSLAAVDAVNPCALAVLLLILTTIIAYNPANKKKILSAGLAFIIAVILTYLIYGLIIIKFFQLIQVLTSVRLWLYKILGIIAVILGILNIKDFIKYKPGGIGTEMPLSLRPKVKKIISGVTSAKGAFGVGIFVTLFLLPCTIGPYVIAGGILSAFKIIKTLSWLLLYNFIFVLPMLIIVGLVYFGFSRVKNVSEWKDKNIKYLHLIAGIIILGLGIVMLLGLI